MLLGEFMTSRALMQFARPLVVKRAPMGAYDNQGKYIAQLPQMMQIMAVVQPLQGQELQLVEEGARTSNTIKLYTDTELRTVDVNKQIDADRVIFNQREYQVFRVEDWSAGGYWKAYCSEVLSDGLPH